MSDQEINWRFNCLTTGVHDGRPEKIWNLPLGYAVQIYGRIALEEMVVARIYNDAMQLVEHGIEPRMPKEWADRVKEIAHERFDATLDAKVKELSDYYQSSMWTNDIQGATGRIERNKLNPHYEPLHGHDSINLLCRILGSGSSGAAARGE